MAAGQMCAEKPAYEPVAGMLQGVNVLESPHMTFLVHLSRLCRIYLTFLSLPPTAQRTA